MKTMVMAQHDVLNAAAAAAALRSLLQRVPTLRTCEQLLRGVTMKTMVMAQQQLGLMMTS
jgi:hypothetical protein